jgi:hypothetical protein
MGRLPVSFHRSRAGRAWWVVALLVGAALTRPVSAHAAATARVQGKVVASDTGEPVGYADLLLVSADSTMRKVGGLSNADGTFLLEAPAGIYSLRVRAISYASKRIEGVVLSEGKLFSLSPTLVPEAIQQQEIVVEARAKTNTEASMLAARKKAQAVGDAVSAEQMRRAPDKTAGDVLRRVTGLSVSDGRYVFVRGLGERYSSTEVDGVRIASPEPNKRVVPMDLFPAALLDNINVQKTYTADRAGEFGGGDVQVNTRDFPGVRMWAFSASQGYAPGVTGATRQTYVSPDADRWGFGAGGRALPDIVNQIAGDRPLSEGSGLGFPASTLQEVEKSFDNVWTPLGARTLPNGRYTATYGDQRKLFGRPFGIVGAGSMSHSFDHRSEIQRDFKNAQGALQDDYQVERYTESAQLGANAALSYRFSPGHQAHLRGFLSNSADDEVRSYEGADTYGDLLYRRSTRLLYVQRSILSGSLEGQDDFANLNNASLSWRLTRSGARRQQPDRRESMYIRVPIDETDPGYWGLATGRREYGDLKDNGWGGSLKASFPYASERMGNGKVMLGFNRDTKRRENYYRRFDFIPATYGSDAAPESVYDKVNEATLAVDNYSAHQKVEAIYVSVDMPFGRRVRSNFGIRRERGQQDVSSHDLFDPSIVTSEGHLDNADWLSGANLTWSVSSAINLRAAASRTLTRPDLDELSPSPTLDYVGGLQRLGNPRLQRGTLESYDLRLEGFPSGTEVLAIGGFYKAMQDPIEYTVRGATSGFVLVPDNSAGGHNLGIEIEARASLGRITRHLQRLSLNSNVSFISSQVTLKDAPTKIGSQQHPLQGQADHLVNAALTYQTPGARLESSLLLSMVGQRLVTLSNAAQGIPDHYDPGFTSLDFTFAVAPFPGARVRFEGSNLLDHEVREMVGPYVAKSYHDGRTYSIGFSYGS